MTYRGYDLRPELFKPPAGIAQDGVAIYADGERIARTTTTALARRVIDTRIASGRWKDRSE